MGLSRNKHNRNFPDRTKAQDGGVVTLTLDLGLRNFKRKALELLLEISLAIPWDEAEGNTIEIYPMTKRHKTAVS